jgi:hypothetical protein
MKKLVLAGLLGVATLLATGCGDKCKKAADRIDARQKACGLNIADPGAASGSSTECTEAAGAASERFAECAEKATCDQVKDGTWITECGK